ncbi:Lin1244/Lin1753 domain-containing protein [Bacteroides sp. 519]|uniref:Lin1244/Lin1753 domain-containing protein n=1 Tax=Bacteroides sp. 519 TaxID=2302937 RepID=UPI0013D5232C|nr:Lin1244/Lin1753 domain-containing protein [Bacteroides sp. 519]NDV57667.1 DUF4373 domain-containing protein [Bacteroides sp. 519]
MMMKTRTYLPIETDILNDDRMGALVNNMGVAGYGIYMILLVELRNHKDYCFGSESLKIIMRKYNIKRAKMEAVLYDYDLFTIDQTENGSLLITSDYVTRVMRNYNDAIAKRSIAGKKNADKRWQKENGNTMATEQNKTEQNKTEQNKTSEKTEKKETAAVAAADIDIAAVYGNEIALVDFKKQHIGWEEYLIEALNDRTWMELQAKHSGLGMRFVKYENDIVRMFMDHVLTHGKEYGLHSVGEVKYYFANFVRQATATNKRITDELDRIELDEKTNSQYRFEDIDPTTGTRTYYGKPIPAEAPPRPNNNAIWIEEVQQWM